MPCTFVRDLFAIVMFTLKISVGGIKFQSRRIAAK